MGDATDSFHNPRGLDVLELLRHARSHAGRLVGFGGGEAITGSELLAADCDVLIPAALGGMITGTNAAAIRAPIVVEAANAPVEPQHALVASESECTRRLPQPCLGNSYNGRLLQMLENSIKKNSRCLCVNPLKIKVKQLEMCVN